MFVGYPKTQAGKFTRSGPDLVRKFFRTTVFETILSLCLSSAGGKAVDWGKPQGVFFLILPRRRPAYNAAMASKYPIFLDLENQRAVVVGGGQVALQKIQALLEASAHVVLVAREIVPVLDTLCRQTPGCEIILSDYAPTHLGRARLVIAATDDRGVNERVYRDCQQAGILCNVVDTPDFCDFYVPAVVRRHPLQIAIGTEGSSPGFAKKIRKQLEGQFTGDHSAFLRQLAALRPEVLSALGKLSERESLLSEFADDESFDFFLAHGASAWQARCRERIPSP